MCPAISYEIRFLQVCATTETVGDARRPSAREIPGLRPGCRPRQDREDAAPHATFYGMAAAC